MKERGSALLTAVIIVMVLLSISGIFFTTLIYQGKNESSEERGLKAYYLAEAGVQYGIAAIWNGELAEESSYEKTEKNLFEQGGKFKVIVTKLEDESRYAVESTGYYGADTERRIKVSYKYVEGSSGGGGSGEDGGYADEEVVKKYPPWQPKVYGDPGTLVNSKNSEGNLRIFYNLWYADTEHVPGKIRPWQEITPNWTVNNWYWLNDIVTFDNRKFIHRWGGPNTGQPGTLTNEWQELTNEWRNFNTYATGDIVTYGGKLFRARDDGAFNELPGLVSSSWQELTKEWRAFNVYDQSQNVYNEVLYNGQRYRAKWYADNDDIPGIAPVWELIPSSQVTLPVFLRVMVSPAETKIAVNETKPVFTAKAIYSDGSTVDVTNTAVWASSDPTTALMTNGGTATGVETGLWTGFFTNVGGPTQFVPVDTPEPITMPITIPITASFEGKVGMAYLTIAASGESEGGGTGTPAEGLLWEREED